MERTTAQRKAIHTVLENAGRPLSPPEIFQEARHMAPGLGMATVYRTIKRLIDDNAIAQVGLPGEAPRYERAGMEHHHHFRCSGCNRVFDWFGCVCPCEESAPKGFQVDGHEVYLFGLCVECVGRNGASAS
jgi:Fur family ferric uptake transcriptional regulator